jgi:dCTP deaminase
MILSSQSIRERCLDGIWARSNTAMPLIAPFADRGVSPAGLSYGLTCAGYDVRLDQDLWLWPKRRTLASTMERFQLPADIKMRICDKSTWARRFVIVKNTRAEPGWRGYLTIEITNESWRPWLIRAGEPIAQVEFEMLDQATDRPYRGKYQDQERGPQPARREHEHHERPV